MRNLFRGRRIFFLKSGLKQSKRRPTLSAWPLPFAPAVPPAGRWPDGTAAGATAVPLPLVGPSLRGTRPSAHDNCATAGAQENSSPTAEESATAVTAWPPPSASSSSAKPDGRRPTEKPTEGGKAVDHAGRPFPKGSPISALALELFFYCFYVLLGKFILICVLRMPISYKNAYNHEQFYLDHVEI